MIVKRNKFYQQVSFCFRNHPIVAILGPRQCGKTTLCRQYIHHLADFNAANYFDLENPQDWQQLQEAQLALTQRQGLIVMDEIQRMPDIFPLLRVLVDNTDLSQQYLILGSASRELIRQTSETLAGRIRYIELTPFNATEVNHWQTLWLRGGYPKSFLAATDADSFDWRQGYISTFLEQDIPNLGFNIPAATLRRFWLMLSHYHGQILNSSELARSLGISDTSIRRYLDILTGTFMVRQLAPWYENIGKRQVKMPKIFLRDSGLYHALLGIHDSNELLNHPKLGASWEGWAIEEIIRYYQATPEECFFWAVHQQAELDLLLIKEGQRHGFEIKYSLSPKLTRSMQQAIELLQLDHLMIITPGKKRYALSNAIEVVGIEALIS